MIRFNMFEDGRWPSVIIQEAMNLARTGRWKDPSVRYPVYKGKPKTNGMWAQFWHNSVEGAWKQ